MRTFKGYKIPNTHIKASAYNPNVVNRMIAQCMSRRCQNPSDSIDCEKCLFDSSNKEKHLIFLAWEKHHG